MEAIFSRLEKIESLPTLPTVIETLGRAIRDPDADAVRISRIIEDDPAIMARVLKVVNSAFYAGAQPVTSVSMAVARVGLNALNNIAISTAVFSALGGRGGVDFDRDEFWRHSICTGIAAGVIYNRAKKNIGTRYSKDYLHLAGLLHDVGKIIFDQYLHEEFKESLKVAKDRNIPLYKAEREVIGVDHSEVGAWLGRRWNLDGSLLSVILLHHDPHQDDGQINMDAALIHIANHICNTEHIGYGGSPHSTFLPGVWKELGLSVADIATVVDDVHEEAKKSDVLMALTQQ